MALSPQDQAGRQRTATFLGLLDSASLLPGQTVVNLYSLRQLCLQGVPENPDWLRAQAWKALLSYLPTEKRDWARTLKARRTEYYQFLQDFLPLSLSPPRSSSTSDEHSSRDNLLDQLYKDLRRSRQSSLAFYHSPVAPSATCPLAPAPQGNGGVGVIPRLECRHDPLTRLEVINHDFLLDQKSHPAGSRGKDVRWHSLLRLLYIYALLNPALGYIQGMNEIAFVLLYAFGHTTADFTAQSEQLTLDDDPDMGEVLRSSEHAEADTFWCFSTLLADIRDLYAFDGLDHAASGLVGDPFRLEVSSSLHLGAGILQSGNMAAALRTFSYRLHWLDKELWSVLRTNHLDPQLPYYSFRWLACLLSTEFSLPSALRIWDMILVEQGPSDPAVSGCAISAKVDLLIDVCCALLVSVRGAIMEAAVVLPDDADGDTGPFGRILHLLQQHLEDDVDPILALALLYRQRRMSAQLTGDCPKYDQDLSPDVDLAGTGAFRKRATDLYHNWMGYAPNGVNAAPSRETYIISGQQAASAGAGTLSRYTEAFQASDTAAQLNKMRTNLTVKAIEGWDRSRRAPSGPPSNVNDASPTDESASATGGWLGRSRAALNAASESFRSVSSLTSATPDKSELDSDHVVASPTQMEGEPRSASATSIQSAHAASPAGQLPATARDQADTSAHSSSSPLTPNQRPSMPPAKRTFSATELLRAKYIDNAPPPVPKNPPAVPKFNSGSAVTTSASGSAPKVLSAETRSANTTPRSSGGRVRQMGSSSSVDLGNLARQTSFSSDQRPSTRSAASSGVERYPSSSSKAESIAMSVSSYETSTVAAGRFMNKKKDASGPESAVSATTTPPKFTSTSGTGVPSRTDLCSEETACSPPPPGALTLLSVGTPAEEGGTVSSASASPLFATPVGSTENLPLSLPHPDSKAPASSSHEPVSTVSGTPAATSSQMRTHVKTGYQHGRAPNDASDTSRTPPTVRPAEKDGPTTRGHRVTEAIKALGQQEASHLHASNSFPLSHTEDRRPKLRKKRYDQQQESTADALSRYGLDQAESGATGPTAPQAFQASAAPVRSAPQHNSDIGGPPDDGIVRYALTDGPNPTSTKLPSGTSPAASPTTSLRRSVAGIDEEGSRRRTRLSSNRKRAAAGATSAEQGTVSLVQSTSHSSSRGAGAPPPSSFRAAQTLQTTSTSMPAKANPTNSLQRTTRTHGHRGNQASENLPSRSAPHTHEQAHHHTSQSTSAVPPFAHSPVSTHERGLPDRTPTTGSRSSVAHSTDGLRFYPGVTSKSSLTEATDVPDASWATSSNSHEQSASLSSAAEAYDYDEDFLNELQQHQDALARLNAAALYD